MIEQKINEFFADAESTAVGTGWWSGVLSVFFGALSFGAVLCLHFPQFLTVPQFRSQYPMPAIRTLIQCLIVSAAVFGILSSILRRKKALALTGLLFATTAAVLGGSSVQISKPLRDGPAIGLDWFLLDLLLTAIIFVPIERLWPLMIAFSQSIILGYLIFVTLQATWSHCNFAPSPRWLARWIFGTYYLPDEWPELYGLDGEQISPGFIGQTIEPFTKRIRN